MRRYCLVLVAALMPGVSLAQRDYYIPKGLLMPLHDQQGQVQLAAGWGGGYGVELSYAATKHVALFSTATLDRGTRYHTTLLGSRYKQYNNNYVLQGGVGYFNALNHSRINRIEAYAGAGVGSVDNSWYYLRLPESTEFTRARYWTAFSQFNLGHRGRTSDLIFGMRLAYSIYHTLAYYDNHPNVQYIRYRGEGLQGLTLEPAVSYGYRWKGFKAAIQGGVAVSVLAPTTTLIATHALDAGPVVTSTREKMPLGALLGRISLQYQFKPRKENTLPQALD